MKKQVKLKTAVEIDGINYAAGTVLKVDEATAKSLIEAGTAEDHDEAAAAEDLQKQIEAGIAKGLESEAAKKSIKEAVAANIVVKDEAIDPSWGYAAPLVAGQKRAKGAILNGASQYLKDVHEAAGGGTPARLVKAMEICEKAAGDGQVIGNDPEGGFAVPTETRIALEGATLDASPVRQSATIVPMSTKTLDVTRIQDYTHASGYISGGAQAYWGSENGALTASKIKLEQVKLDLQPLTALGYMSHQAMKFSAVSGGLLVQELGQAIAFAEEGAFLTDGTGAGMPQAIMNAAAKISITRNTTVRVLATDIWSMIARLRIKNAGAVKWIANQELLPQFAQLNLAVGTGGAAIWMPSNDATQGFPGTLYGYPVQWSEYPEALGTAGDLILGDFSQYEIGDFVEGPEAAESIHIKFLEAQTAYRIIKYVDGQVSPKKVYTPKHGATRAPFIHLSTK